MADVSSCTINQHCYSVLSKNQAV